MWRQTIPSLVNSTQTHIYLAIHIGTYCSFVCIHSYIFVYTVHTLKEHKYFLLSTVNPLVHTCTHAHTHTKQRNLKITLCSLLQLLSCNTISFKWIIRSSYLESCNRILKLLRTNNSTFLFFLNVQRICN